MRKGVLYRDVIQMQRDHAYTNITPKQEWGQAKDDDDYKNLWN